MFYDEVGNRVKEVLPENYDPQTDNGPGTTYTYDLMNRLEEVSDAEGTVIQRRVYDINSLLSKLIDAAGYLSGTDDASRYGVEYTYDIGNRIKTITSPEAKIRGMSSESYTYDANGNILSSTDGNHKTTVYERDMWGKITKVTDAKNINTFYTYDFAGNLTSSTDGNNHATAYEYNSLNKLASITDPAGNMITYKYDLEGRLTQEHDRNNRTINYSYNSDGNPTLKEIAGSGEKEQYLYNKAGNLFASVNSSGIDQFRYTEDDLLKERTRNGKPYIEYEYDKNRNIIGVTDGSGKTVSYMYDILGRLEAVSDGSAQLAQYNYNPDSTIATINYDTGINVSYAYDRDKNISGMVNRGPQDNVIGSYSYTYDNNGNQLTKTENGSTTIYTYDELNRLKTANYPGLGLETYTYDNAGNRLSKVLGADNTTYAYDARNRLTQSINNGITTTYAYDGNGNLIQLTKGTENTIYTYDGFNRLRETSMSDGQWMAYDYDAFGLRVSTIENGNWYDFTLDRGNVIAEKTGEDDITRYIRGIDLIAKTDNGEAPAYYLHNVHGDVVNLVNGSGEVLNSYTYDAFGNTASYSETVANRFMYAGEQFDKITGEYYLRARYYDPTIGRFTQEDTYRGDGLNLYTYVGNNPLLYFLRGIIENIANSNKSV